jgi:hypothetical protein
MSPGHVLRPGSPDVREYAERLDVSRQKPFDYEYEHLA